MIVNDREATARSLLSLQTDALTATKHPSTTWNQTFSDYQQAMATQVNSITATVNGHTSAITTHRAGHCERQHDLKAMYSIKVGLSSNGQYWRGRDGYRRGEYAIRQWSQVIFPLTASLAVTHHVPERLLRFRLSRTGR